MKQKRQSEILKIIAEKSISTHDQLITELLERGITVTQATVSRDIKELRLIKVPSKSGSVYATASTDTSVNTGMLSTSVLKIQKALHTVVLRTQPGMASGVAASLDDVMSDMILGSVAGDDTVLIIASDTDKASEITLKLKTMFNYRGE